MANGIKVLTEDELAQMGIEYALRVLELDRQMAELRSDIKIIKKEASQDGVAVKQVNRALKFIKSELKKSEVQITEEQLWIERFEGMEEIKNKLATLIEIESGN